MLGLLWETDDRGALWVLLIIYESVGGLQVCRAPGIKEQDRCAKACYIPTYLMGITV